jgi:hypothetical protein
LRQLKQKFPEELVIIGVHSAKFPSEQLTANIRQAAMRLGIEHPVVNDAGFKVWNSYAVRAWPTLVLVDPTGRIAGEVSGEIMAEEFAQNIIEVIQQHPDAIDRTPLELRPEAHVEPDRPLRFPSRMLLQGNCMFISDSGHHRIIELQLDEDGLSGEVLRVFGSGEAALRDGPAEQAAFNHPHGLGLDGDPQSGTLYVADTENHAVRSVDLATGSVQTLAGTGQKAHGRLSMGSPLETPLRSPWAVLPLDRYLLIAMAGSHQIWVLIDRDQLGSFAGNGYEALVDGPVGESSFNQPSDLAFGMGYIFVADPEASAVRAISIGETPQTITLVGKGLFDFGDQDGPASDALLQHPTGLAVEGTSIYIADTYNNKIKLLNPLEGQVETLVGSGIAGSRDGSFEQAQLFEPEGVQVQQGRVYIADTNNHAVRVADLNTRQVHTFRMRGLDRLAQAPGGQPQAEILPTVEVGPSVVRLTIEPDLPSGYHRSADNPALLRIAGEDGQSQVLSFDAGQPIEWRQRAASDQDLPLDLALYYCQSENAQLCLIHDRKLVLPLRVVPGGPSEARIRYPVALPQFRADD